MIQQSVYQSTRTRSCCHLTNNALTVMQIQFVPVQGTSVCIIDEATCAVCHHLTLAST